MLYPCKMQEVKITDFVAREHASLVVTSAVAVALPASKIHPTVEPFKDQPCRKIVVTLDPDSDSVRITYSHDTTPTNTLGDILTGGDIFVSESGLEIQNFKAIALTGNVTLRITYKF